jgi:hypothetical protein
MSLSGRLRLAQASFAGGQDNNRRSERFALVAAQMDQELPNSIF